VGFVAEGEIRIRLRIRRVFLKPLLSKTDAIRNHKLIYINLIDFIIVYKITVFKPSKRYFDNLVRVPTLKSIAVY